VTAGGIAHACQPLPLRRHIGRFVLKRLERRVGAGQTRTVFAARMADHPSSLIVNAGKEK
jgi:hypothetical protein